MGACRQNRVTASLSSPKSGGFATCPEHETRRAPARYTDNTGEAGSIGNEGRTRKDEAIARNA
jgi:hypothetical protein